MPKGPQEINVERICRASEIKARFGDTSCKHK